MPQMRAPLLVLVQEAGVGLTVFPWLAEVGAVGAGAGLRRVLPQVGKGIEGPLQYAPERGRMATSFEHAAMTSSGLGNAFSMARCI